PLRLPAFRDMWADCLARSSEDIRERISAGVSSTAEVHSLAGGWPFYAKVIGEHMAAGCVDTDTFYENLLQHFSVVWSRLSEAERVTVLEAACGTTPRRPVNDLIR